MAVNEDLRTSLRAHLSARADVEEKAMFGGVGFMWRGNLVCGVLGDELLVRVGKEDAETFIGEDAAHPMVMGGRTSRGWILVPVPPDQRDDLLARWVQRALSHGSTLPAK